MSDASDPERTIKGNPLLEIVNHVLERKAARPQDVYRLAVIVQALLDSLENPDALETIRTELKVLIEDIKPTVE